MMHRRALLILSLVVSLSVACGLLPTPVPTSSPSAAWQSTVDDLAALQGGLEFPDHFEDENAARTGDEFDVNAYFSILEHLAMEPGYVLDYVYCYDGMGGYPKLYARPEDRPRYVTCSDYSAAESYLDHVQTDGTAEGFFQFVLLQVVGGQFYLYWHANYYDDVVVCDRETVESIVSVDDGFGYPFSDAQKRAARAIAPAPIVELGDEVVTVKIVTFSNWGGFAQETYEINRSFPHTILESEYEVLVEYDCGIMF